MKLIIRTLTTADLDSANQILSSAFGTTNSRQIALKFILGLQPDGRFLALADGTPVGLVGAVDYGQFAYVGTMGVLPAWQGRGIGRRLMEHLLGWLDERHCPMAVLDATEAGARLYLKLGFVTDEETVEWQGQGEKRARGSERVRAARESDLTGLARLDAPIFGAERSAVLRGYLSRYPDRVFVAEDVGNQAIGYIAAPPRAIGPWAARRAEDAEALLAAALTLGFEQPPRVLVPSSNLNAAHILERHGFQSSSAPHLHMRRGGRAAPGERSRLYALASFAIG